MKFTKAERLKRQSAYAAAYPGILKDFTRRLVGLDMGAFECFQDCYDSVLRSDTFAELHRLARLGRSLEAPFNGC